MSFEIRDISLSKKKNKNIYSKFSFSLKDGELATCLYYKKKEKDIFVQFLLGNIYPNRGSLWINENNITTYTKTDRNIAIVKLKKFSINNLIPIKLQFLISHSFQLITIYNMFIKYYLKFKKNLLSINKNKLYLELRVSLDDLIGNFLDMYLKNNNDYSNNAILKLNQNNDKNIESFLKKRVNSLTKLWLSTYLSKRTEILVEQQKLSFLQAIWDSINALKDLTLSCDCIKNIRKNKIKNVNKKDFNYLEINEIVDLYLKTISTSIIKTRYSIFAKNKKIKLYHREIKKNIKEYKVKKDIIHFIKNNIIFSTSHTHYLFNTTKKMDKNFSFAWKLEKEYIKKEKILTEKIIPNDLVILKNKVINLIHSYHLQILKHKVKNISKKEYRNLKKTQNESINSKYNDLKNLSSNVYEKSKIIMKNLGIDSNTIFKNNSLYINKFKLSLVNLILSNKEIIILDNIFKKLTKKEQIQVYQIVDNVFKSYPNIKILIMSNNFLYYNKFNTKYLLLTDYQNLIYYPKDFSMQYIANPKNIWMYKTIFHKNINFVKPSKINQQNWSNFLDNISNYKNYNFFINPLFINFEATKTNQIILNGKITKVKKLNNNYYLIIFRISKIFKIHILNLNPPSNNNLDTIYINSKYINYYEKGNKKHEKV